MDERAAIAHAARKVDEWEAKLGDAIETAYRSGKVTGVRDAAALAGGRAPEWVRKLLRTRGVPLQSRGRRATASDA